MNPSAPPYTKEAEEERPGAPTSYWRRSSLALRFAVIYIKTFVAGVHGSRQCVVVYMRTTLFANGVVSFVSCTWLLR